MLRKEPNPLGQSDMNLMGPPGNNMFFSHGAMRNYFHESIGKLVLPK